MTQEKQKLLAYLSNTPSEHPLHALLEKVREILSRADVIHTSPTVNVPRFEIIYAARLKWLVKNGVETIGIAESISFVSKMTCPKTFETFSVDGDDWKGSLFFSQQTKELCAVLLVKK